MTLDVAGWINSPPVELTDLRGRVVLIEAFQMLCPGCVSHGLPQAQRVHRAFGRDDVVVLGLHTVFEHHDVMGPDALAAFVSEYRIGFPVAIDRPVEGRSLPATMARYGLRGTPTTLLVDRAGRLRHELFGALDDLTLGAHLGRLLAEPHPSDLTDRTTPAPAATTPANSCGPDGCT
jgi:thiol-disulfide isomerase/thioredoxin